MNERIRKLAIQAGIELPDDSAYNGHIYRNSIERFGKLIIAQCTGLCEDLGTEGDGQNCVDAINDYFKV